MKELVFACPSCDQHIQCDATHAGENIPCPSCAVLIRVPSSHVSADVEVAVTPKPSVDTDNPFNNATGKDAVSYTPIKSAAPEKEQDQSSAPEAANAPVSNRAEAQVEKSPVTNNPPPPREIYCVCPTCQAELRLHTESLAQPAGTLVPAEVVRPSPMQVTPPAPARIPGTESEPTHAPADTLADRERKIAAARESPRIQVNPTVKPRLSYILTGGEAPASAENDSVHDPVPQPKPTGDSDVHSLSE